MRKNKNVKRAAVTALALTMVAASISAAFADVDNVAKSNELYVLGDLNADGEVDIKDSALLKRYLAGWDVEFIRYGRMGTEAEQPSEENPDEENPDEDGEREPAGVATIENVTGGDFIKGRSEATIKFKLNEERQNVEVKILNSMGTAVYSESYEKCEADEEYSFKWDGKISDEEYANAGSYKVLIGKGLTRVESELIKFETESVFDEGDGSESNPYTVKNMKQLKEIGKKSTRCFKQVNDITDGGDISELGGGEFEGKYDGNGYKITKLTITGKGIFSEIGETGVIGNLQLEECVADNAVLAYENKGTIQDCQFDECKADNGSEEYVGVICGINHQSGSIISCEVNNSGAYTVVASSAIYVGGICGYNDGKISDTTFRHTETYSNPYTYISVYNAVFMSYCGGICGINGDNGLIQNCTFEGNIGCSDSVEVYVKSRKVSSTKVGDSPWYLGGIAGKNSGWISHCKFGGKFYGGFLNYAEIAVNDEGKIE